MHATAGVTILESNWNKSSDDRNDTRVSYKARLKLHLTFTASFASGVINTIKLEKQQAHLTVHQKNIKIDISNYR